MEEKFREGNIASDHEFYLQIKLFWRGNKDWNRRSGGGQRLEDAQWTDRQTGHRQIGGKVDRKAGEKRERDKSTG